MNLGPTELIIILVIVLVLFGSTRLPKLARSLGQASKEFKKGIDDKDAEDNGEEDKPEAAKAADEKVTMSKADLDALLAEREAKAREAAQTAPAAPPPPPDVPPSG
jgi:sec-independent protein translocase protein TatA